MRQITHDAALAFINGTKFKRDNTQVRVREKNTVLYLHGNIIAVHDHKYALSDTLLTLSGWNTPTTRERLNGLLELLGHRHRFAQRDFCAYVAHGGELASIDPNGVYSVATFNKLLNAAN